MAGWPSTVPGAGGVLQTPAGTSDLDHAHLAATTVAKDRDGSINALNLCSTIELVVETQAPARAPRADRTAAIASKAPGAIHRTFLASTVDWNLSDDEVAGSLTSFGRSAGVDVEAKRDETLAFMQHADSKATRKAPSGALA